MIRLDLQKELLSLFPCSDTQEKQVYYLNNSKTWYIAPNQAKAYLASHNDRQYASFMLDSEFNLLKHNSKQILYSLPTNFSYLDMGPGLAKKSKLLLKQALALGKTPFYSAIDISPFILNAASETLNELDIEKKLFVGDFANSDDMRLMCQQIPQQERFFYLGTTFSNYDPYSFLYYLKHRVLEDNDLVYLSMQEQVADIESLLEQYALMSYMEGLAQGVRDLGFDSTKMKLRYNEQSYTIEKYLEIETVPPLLKHTPLKKGDEVVFFSSRKPTREYFQEQISNFLDGDFYFEHGFMSFVGKKNSKHN